MAKVLFCHFVFAASAAKAQTVTFNVVPQNGQDGRAFYMKVIWFNQCRNVQGVDPWNRLKCRRWEPVTAGNPVRVTPGRYCVSGEWEGQIHRGSFNLPMGTASMNYSVKPTRPIETCP